ncbi:hypothetical protein M407DRAFT_116561 [Tulasnella calospora MUT 4182]|uniref:Uncharacterized protein n=1 Tax=Tulasnella calospora MUT 4182 TaxID=1051891 RepID=A0A0C3LMR9_9AGAM|nr:hypothetical protein M407DRAFT_116561 [Tulasnella calospora MUT 4182]
MDPFSCSDFGRSHSNQLLSGAGLCPNYPCSHVTSQLIPAFFAATIHSQNPPPSCRWPPQPSTHARSRISVDPQSKSPSPSPTPNLLRGLRERSVRDKRKRPKP